MNKELHEAAKLLREAIEKYSTGKKAIVYWAAIDDSEVISGITMSDDIESHELEHATFCLAGRAYGLVEYNNQNND